MAKMDRQQLPLRLPRGRKTDVRAQFAALCWRINADQLQVCLITSRTRKRWIIPKGWPMHKQTPASAAATEAYEEAGLTGLAVDHCLGVYSYRKPHKLGNAPIVTLVYPVQVLQVHRKWPEHKQRRRKWVTPDKAASRLSEPALKRIVAGFDPDRLEL